MLVDSLSSGPGSPKILSRKTNLNCVWYVLQVRARQPCELTDSNEQISYSNSAGSREIVGGILIGESDEEDIFDLNDGVVK